MNPSSSKIIIVRFKDEVNITLRRSPVRDLLATFPTRTGKAVDPTGFEPAHWNMTGSCAADYTTGPEVTLECCLRGPQVRSPQTTLIPDTKFPR